MLFAALAMSEAKEVNKNAQTAVRRAKKAYEAQRIASGAALESLGAKKLDVLERSMKRFVASFEQLQNVELTESAGMHELSKFRIDRQSFAKLKKLDDLTPSILAAGAAGGIIAATAGSLVAGPAIALISLAFGTQASEQKDKAYANLAKAMKIREELETAGVACNAIRRRAYMFCRLLIRMDSLFMPLIVSMEQTIAAHGTDFRTFSNDEKHTVAAAVSIAGAIKAVLDTPILTADGKLTEESAQIAKDISEKIA